MRKQGYHFLTIGTKPNLLNLVKYGKRFITANLDSLP